MISIGLSLDKKRLKETMDLLEKVERDMARLTAPPRLTTAYHRVARESLEAPPEEEEEEEEEKKKKKRKKSRRGGRRKRGRERRGMHHTSVERLERVPRVCNTRKKRLRNA